MEKKQGARTDLTSDQNDPKSQTADKLAGEYNVSPATINLQLQRALHLSVVISTMVRCTPPRTGR